MTEPSPDVTTPAGRPGMPDAPDSFLLEAGQVVTVDDDARVLAEHAIVVEHGTIVALLPHAEARARHPGLPVIERHRHIAMPGLVNAHTHLAMNLLKGFADDLPLMTWLNEHIWPVENRLVDADFVYHGSRLALAESLLGGVTTVNDMYFFPERVADACRDVGIRATLGMIVVDFPNAWADSTERHFERGLALHDRCRDDPLLNTAFAPHAPYTVSREPLERIATLSAELDVPVHMHVHETAAEVADFEAAHGVRPIARLHEIGLLGPSLLAVHLTQLTGEEITLLGESGVHVLHCPESNLKLASGFCPVAALLAAGCRVAVGTDGAASNNDLDMFGELRTAALLAKAVSGNAAAVPAMQALRMGTIDGARALGIDALTGSLETGKRADIVCVEPDLSMLPMYDAVSQLVYCATRDRVSDVWVDGVQRVRDRTFTHLDLDALRDSASDWARRVQQC